MTSEQTRLLKKLIRLRDKEYVEERKREQAEIIKNIKRFKKYDEVKVTTNELGTILFTVSANTRTDRRSDCYTLTPLENVQTGKAENKLYLAQYSDTPDIFLRFDNKSTGQTELELLVVNLDNLDK